MKKRIVAAAVLVPVLFVVVLAAPKIVAAVIFAVLNAIGVYELLYRTGIVGHIRLVSYSAVAAMAVTIWSSYGAIQAYLFLGILVFFMLLFMEVMLDHVKVRIEMVGMCMVAGFVIPYLLTSLIRILGISSGRYGVDTGRYFIMIPFVVAFMSDAGAYFIGLRFGRHKLAPVVSPNKTIEGFFGGLAFSAIGMLIYAIILSIAFKFRVNYGIALLYGILGSLAGVFGDLCFSVIKRQTGIKDYGYLIPGHGGFFDRFDSMVLVAPLMEALLILLRVAE